MDKFMEWLYFHYIMPVLEDTDRGAYEENIIRLREALDARQTTDFEMTLEFYASAAFLLGVRMGAGLGPVLKEEPH